jgi:nucleoid-associated protein YgaU
MPDGRVFTNPSLIQPGWRLDIPQPTRVVDERADGTWYVVQPGDTLNGIAARFLGQPTRWPEVYALNRSAAGNPNLLRPGMQLHLPLSDRGAASTTSSPTMELGGVGLWPS